MKARLTAEDQPLVLASGSPRRRELLAELGIPFEVKPVCGSVELAWESASGCGPREFVLANARAKAAAAREAWPGRWLLAADTVVVLEGDVLGKPRDEAEAADFLRRLAGRTHEVVTSMVVLRPGGLGGEWTERTTVTFLPLDEAAIAAYLQAVPVLDKAGAYAIQERGEDLVAEVHGSISNVIGLPVDALADLLRLLDATA